MFATLKPTIVIERVTTPFGELTLTQHDRDFAIGVPGVSIMSSRDHRSEDELGRITCVGLASHAAPRVMIGGLGLGYTARAALDVLPAGARVDIVELVPDVVRWNRTIYGHLAKHPLADPRVTVIEDDVARVLVKPPARYDAITIDVDNGPDGIGYSNTELYRSTTIACAYAALAAGGLYTVWSSFDSPTFTTWLRKAGFTVDVQRVRTGQATHWIWLARKR